MTMLFHYNFYLAGIVDIIYFLNFCLYAIRSATPRRKSNGIGFSFRLEERAEKRKEVGIAATSQPVDVIITNVAY